MHSTAYKWYNFVQKEKKKIWFRLFFNVSNQIVKKGYPNMSIFFVGSNWAVNFWYQSATNLIRRIIIYQRETYGGPNYYIVGWLFHEKERIYFILKKCFAIIFSTKTYPKNALVWLLRECNNTFSTRNTIGSLCIW